MHCIGRCARACEIVLHGLLRQSALVRRVIFFLLSFSSSYLPNDFVAVRFLTAHFPRLPRLTNRVMHLEMVQEAYRQYPSSCQPYGTLYCSPTSWVMGIVNTNLIGVPNGGTGSLAVLTYDTNMGTATVCLSRGRMHAWHALASPRCVNITVFVSSSFFLLPLFLHPLLGSGAPGHLTSNHCDLECLCRPNCVAVGRFVFFFVAHMFRSLVFSKFVCFSQAPRDCKPFLEIEGLCSCPCSCSCARPSHHHHPVGFLVPAFLNHLRLTTFTLITCCVARPQKS